MAERGIEFEPVAVRRPPRRPGARTAEELLAAHAELIDERRSAATRRARQGATLRIRNIERELLSRGVEFDAAELEQSRRARLPAPQTAEEPTEGPDGSQTAHSDPQPPIIAGRLQQLGKASYERIAGRIRRLSPP
jgi:hypothetical protein